MNQEAEMVAAVVYALERQGKKMSDRDGFADCVD
jgi:hypothetical protein